MDADDGRGVADALLRLTEEAGDTLALPQLPGRICRMTVELARVDRCALYLWSKRRRAMAPVAERGTPRHVVRRITSGERGAEIIAFEQELLAGPPVVLCRADPPSPLGARILAEAEVHALAIVPLSRRGRTIGCLVLGVHEPPAFREASLEIANTVAVQAASLIDHARLLRKVQKAAVFRAGVAKLAATLNVWNDRSVIARLVCKRGAELFKVDTGILFRRDGDGLVAIASTGPQAERFVGLSAPLDDETIPVVKAFRDARPVFTNDLAAADPPLLLALLGLRSLLAVPLIGAEGTNGCLVYGDTERRHVFTDAIGEEGMELGSIATGALERTYSAAAEAGRRDAELRAVELARYAEELAAARNAALDAARAKAEFLANMSHEIRTPMSAILGYLDLLSRPETTDAQREAHRRTIRRNGEHLMRILDDILDLSKIEAGKLCVERTACSPVEVLGEVDSLMRPRATEKGLRFEVEYRGPIPEVIHADPTRLRQILLNLVSNAIKFTAAGGVRIEVSLATAADAARPLLGVDVVDTGIGMPSDTVEKLFAPFTQADASMRRRFGGTGLGLAISKRLAEMLGGDIVVRSTAGHGSVFSLTVEAGELHGVTMLENPTALRARATAPPAPALAAEAPLRARLLVAEDTADIRELLVVQLEAAGAEVEVAENGLVACERALAANARGTPFDVILMDMQMPELDGEEATMRLRRAGYGGRIIALTAHALPSERERCLRAGCDDFTSKPIAVEALLETIRRHVKAPAPPSIVSRLKGNASIAALLDKFVTGLPDRLAAIEQSVASGDFEATARQAHKLKGSSGVYGFPPISEAAGRLEASARARSLEIVRRQLAEVTELCREARVGGLSFD